FDANGAVGPRGQRRSEGRFRLLGGQSHHDDLTFAFFGGLAIFREAQRRLEGVFVEGVDLPLEPRGVDGTAAARNLDSVRVVGIGDAFHDDKDLHELPPVFTNYLLVVPHAGSRKATGRKGALSST